MTETVVKSSPPLSYTQKLSLIAGSATVLYFLPSEAQAADIRYTDNRPITITFGQAGQTVGWDVDGNGTTDFRLAAAAGGSFIELTSNGLSGRGFVQDSLDAPEDIRWLQENVIVSNFLGANVFNYVWGGTNVSNRTVLYFDGSSFFQTNVRPSTQPSGFIGFRFLGEDVNGNDEIQYGWATMIVARDQATLANSRVTIIEWAYNATPCGPIRPDGMCTNNGVLGAAIEVGNRGGGGGTPTVPEPTSPLALLALGAAGVYRWRKERQETEN